MFGLHSRPVDAWGREISEVKDAWRAVASLHPQVREFQNGLAAHFIGKPVDLPAAVMRVETNSCLLPWLSHADTYVSRLGTFPKIIVDGCYVRDFYNKRIGRTMSLPHYILNRVASAEGARTANHVVLTYGQPAGMWGEEYIAMDALGDFLGRETMRHLGLHELKIREATERAFANPRNLGMALIDPLMGYDLLRRTA